MCSTTCIQSATTRPEASGIGTLAPTASDVGRGYLISACRVGEELAAIVVEGSKRVMVEVSTFFQAP